MEAAVDISKISWITEQEILEKFNISQTTLWRYRKQKENPFPKPIWLGRNVYLESEVYKWLLANRR